MYKAEQHTVKNNIHDVSWAFWREIITYGWGRRGDYLREEAFELGLEKQ